MKVKDGKQIFEIGLTYKKDGKYYIAVGKKKLVTFNGEKFTVRTPGVGRFYKSCRKLSVAKICSIWKIDMAKLDELSPLYFTPKEYKKSVHEPSPRTILRRQHNRGHDGFRVLNLSSI